MSVRPHTYGFEAGDIFLRKRLAGALAEVDLLLLVEPFVEAYSHGFVSYGHAQIAVFFVIPARQFIPDFPGIGAFEFHPELCEP